VAVTTLSASGSSFFTLHFHGPDSSYTRLVQDGSTTWPNVAYIDVPHVSTDWYRMLFYWNITSLAGLTVTALVLRLPYDFSPLGEGSGELLSVRCPDNVQPAIGDANSALFAAIAGAPGAPDGATQVAALDPSATWTPGQYGPITLSATAVSRLNAAIAAATGYYMLGVMTTGEINLVNTNDQFSSNIAQPAYLDAMSAGGAVVQRVQHVGPNCRKIGAR
jgi:hypothetical protein